MQLGEIRIRVSDCINTGTVAGGIISGINFGSDRSLWCLFVSQFTYLIEDDSHMNDA